MIPNTIKIKLDCWWSNQEAITKRFIDQFVFDEDLKNYQFIRGRDESIDWLAVFGRTKFSKYSLSKDSILVFSQEPVWSPKETKNLHLFSDHCFVSDLRSHEPSDAYKEGLLPMFYGSGGESAASGEYSWDKRLKSSDLSRSKTKNISFIIRKNYEHHPENDRYEILYEKRTRLAELIAKQNKKIHIYGKYWNNNGSNTFGEIKNKRAALNDYRFSVACENTIQKNYISEKFWDCILTECVPIYLGCSNISDYIPEDCFINLTPLSHDLSAMAQKITDIENNAAALYESYIPKIKALKKRFFSDSTFNLWEKIKKEIAAR